jgi:asparagine synthase (glutamine-hydrolysing)
MCGIAGILGESSGRQSLLKRMGGSLAHRGPDDQGIWADPEASVGLVNRRLAIIDLSPAGHQPVHSSNERFVLTFNGEIYNHADLRAELEARGAIPDGGWRGHSDTETLIEAIATLGLGAALGRCAGMFAFALWDRKERRLSLVRDRFGEKPLYYGWAGSDFVFASELKAIRILPGFGGEIDRRAVGLFASRSYIPAPLSIYRGIFKLEPGCVLELTADAARSPLTEPPREGSRSKAVSLTRYWSYRDVVRAGLDNPIEHEAEALEELERVLAESIRTQSIADVPVGAFLSGGIDSSTIVALYQKYSPQPVRTFTIGFEEQAYNEADHARAVAKHFGTDHNERMVTPREARDVIPKLPQIYDEPFADSSQIPTYLVSAFAREQVTVALSGDAGDELFGGYNRYFMTARAWGRLAQLPAPLRAAAAGSLAAVPAAMWDRLGALSGGRFPREFGSKVRKSMGSFAGARDLGEAFTSFVDEWADEGSPIVGGNETLNPRGFDLDVGENAPDTVRMMYCDAVGYLPDDILCKVDRASMAVSLEAHVPYLDHRVAEMAARIPVSMKIEGKTGKKILRTLLYQEAPKRLFERPKTGFGIPVGEWIKGSLREWAEDLLDRDRMASEGWFDPEPVLRRWRDHLSGRRHSTAALWSVLMFNAWLRKRQEETVAMA